MLPIPMDDIVTLLRLVRKGLGANSLHRLLDKIEAEAQGDFRARMPGIKTAEELIVDAGRLPPMLVDELLPDHSLFLLTGKPKAGKSFLALDIADSVSRGLPVLGTLAVNRPGPVLYLAMEDGRIELARRLAQRKFQPGVHPLYFIDEPFSLTDPLHYARFRELALSLPVQSPAAAPDRAAGVGNPGADRTEPQSARRPSLIVIDTAAEALDIRDWINRSEILVKIAPIRRLAREICTVLLVAHNRKAEGEMGDEIAGSNALAGAVDGWISTHKVERRANGNRRLFLRIEGRGGVGHELIAEMDCHTLKFSRIPLDQAESDSVSIRQDIRAARRRDRRALAHKALVELGGQATIAELASAMGFAYSAVWPLVRDMAAAGEIETVPTAYDPDKPGRQAPVYRAAPKEPLI